MITSGSLQGVPAGLYWRPGEKSLLRRKMGLDLADMASDDFNRQLGFLFALTRYSAKVEEIPKIYLDAALQVWFQVSL